MRTKCARAAGHRTVKGITQRFSDYSQQLNKILKTVKAIFKVKSFLKKLLFYNFMYVLFSNFAFFLIVCVRYMPIRSLYFTISLWAIKFDTIINHGKELVTRESFSLFNFSSYTAVLMHFHTLYYFADSARLTNHIHRQRDRRLTWMKLTRIWHVLQSFQFWLMHEALIENSYYQHLNRTAQTVKAWFFCPFVCFTQN